MASRQINLEAYHWSPTSPTSSSQSHPIMQQVQLPPSQQVRHLPSQTSVHNRDHQLLSHNQGYMHSTASGYFQARAGAVAHGSMSDTISAPLASHHIQDSHASHSAAGAHSLSEPFQYGSSISPAGFAYPSPSFYTNPPPPQYASDSISQQQYYDSQHATSSADPHSTYNHPPSMGADLSLAANEQFHHSDPNMMHAGPYGSLQAIGARIKRKQVKNACVNCQRVCKKCDEGRPCSRCVKYGLSDSCQDSARKERRRGVKRGPYKRRATTGSQPNPVVHLALQTGSVPSGYHRDGYISPGSRSVDGIATVPPESSFSSPAFANQALASRPPMSLNLPNTMSSSWQTSSSSPSLRSVDEEREDMRSSRLGHPATNSTNVQGSYYGGYESQDNTAAAYSYDRSSSVPITGPGSLALSPIGSYHQFPNPPSLQASSHHFSSLVSGTTPSSSGNLNGAYNSSIHRSNSSLISPPLYSNSTSTFLGTSAAAPPPMMAHHHRLHSDSSLMTLSSAGASASAMSPRTPLNGQPPEYSVMSPSVNKTLASSSYMPPPQPTVPSTSSPFLRQEMTRPFPLKMPKALQRTRSITTSGHYFDASSRPPRLLSESNHFGNVLVPLRRDSPPPPFPENGGGSHRSLPYIGSNFGGHHHHSHPLSSHPEVAATASTSFDDSLLNRRSSLVHTPRMDMSPNASASMSSASSMGGSLHRPDKEVSSSLGMA